MGVQLTGIIEAKELSLEQLFDKAIAVDAFNWLYQFLSIIRQPDGTPLKDSRGNITSHLSGLYYRTLRLMEAGIMSVYVFDGKPPEFKQQTAEHRRDVRAEARREWTAALQRGDLEAARKFAQRSSELTGSMIEDSRQLLDAMGLPAIQAVSEGEALCAAMAKKGDVFATATQDYDSLLFGCPVLVRNLSITGKKKRGDAYITVNPEMIMLNDALDALGITQEQLITLGILVGTDYNPGGVAGYGPKRALELVREKKTLGAVLEVVPWDFDVPADEIFEFFKSPALSDYDITFRDVNEEAIMKILCDEHDFSQERISNALKKLSESRSGQKYLGRFFG